MTRRQPSACELVAAAFNRQGVPSDDGEPWTEDKVADVYNRTDRFMNVLGRDPRFTAAAEAEVNRLWPAVEMEAARRGLKLKRPH